jgi:uncharacterized protein (TIGR02679 family)
MSTTRDDRLQRLLGGDHLAMLRKRLRRRFERAEPDQAREKFRISQITTEEHAVLASLIGRPPQFSGSLQIDLRELDAALARAGIAISLRDALEQLDGPITNPAAARDVMRARWSAVVDGCGHPDLARFLQAPIAIGLLKRLSGGNPDAAAELCCRVEAVLQRLPANGLTRAQLAADVLGDAHALDNGRPAATLVLAVWRQGVALAAARQGGADTLADLPGEDGNQQDAVEESARDVWARAGVLVNELARPALFLNLPGVGPESGVQVPGEPGYVSLRTLLRSPPAWAVAGCAVYVCENPNLLAIAADRLGQRCPPMVCTDGMPSAAQRRLLNHLAQAGAVLRYHGDFDWSGLRIGNYVMREYGARPWRFGAEDYSLAVQTAPRPGHRLEGAEVLASWDAGLAPVMQDHQLAIAEEGVAGSLLEDLDGAI